MAAEAAKKFIESTVQEYNLVVFAKTWCGHCKKTKELLTDPKFEGVKMKVYDLDQMPEGSPTGPAMQHVLANMTGQKSVPSIFINGQYFGGNDKIQEAWTSGELSKSLAISA